MSPLIAQYTHFRYLIRVAWSAAILAVISGSLLPHSSWAIHTLDRLRLSDKIEHTAAYALLAFLPALHERRNMVMCAAAGAVALGVGLEFAQGRTGLRNFEVTDMAADCLGVALGLLSGAAARTRFPSQIRAQ